MSYKEQMSELAAALILTTLALPASSTATCFKTAS